MEKKIPYGMIIHLPVFTLSILFMSGVATVFPDVAVVMIYDRSAISNGEIWRLITGHFVHFNNTHLAYNLFVFGVSGLIVERKGYPYFKSLCLLIALFISLAIFFFKPNMIFYGGLSGLAFGSASYFAFWGLVEVKPWQTICLFLLFFITVKIILEFLTGSSVLPYWESKAFVTVPLSHLIGSFAAFLFFMLFRKKTLSIETIVVR